MNVRTKAEAEMVAALETVQSPDGKTPVKVSQIEAAPGDDDQDHIIWRFVGAEWPGDRPLSRGRPPLHEYEITVATQSNADNARRLADGVYDALMGLDGYALFGETGRIEETGWTAVVNYSVVLNT